MKRTTFLNLLAATLCFALTPATFPQTTSGSMLFAPNIDLSSGPQNTFVGTVGGIFLTTYSFYPKVNWLGYYDQNGDGLANSHVVTLWDNSTQSIIASVTVPAGSPVLLVQATQAIPMRPQPFRQHLRQYRHPVLVSFSTPDNHLLTCQVHVLHAEPQQFHQTQPAAVHQLRHQAGRAVHRLEEPLALLPG